MTKAGASDASTAREPRDAWLTHSAWLSERVLLVLGRIPRRGRTQPRVAVGALRAEGVTAIPYATGTEKSSTGAPTALVARFAARDTGVAAGAVTVEIGGATLELDGRAQSVRDVLREGLAWLDPGERGRLVDAIGEAARPADDPSLGDGLHLVREALRERLPACVLDPSRSRCVHVDALTSIDSTAFYIEGWALSFGEPIDRLTAVSPEGMRIELTDRMHWYERPDIGSFALSGGRTAPARPGFLCFFETPHPSERSEGWIIEMVDAAAVGIEAPAPPVIRDPEAARSMLLGDLVLETRVEERLRADHLRPALTRLLDRQRSEAVVDRVLQFGEPPADPAASIVVPLYGRIDLLEHQMLEFVHDPELLAADLVYVLDSPELAPALEGYAQQLARLYRVPFRVALMRANGGFSRANNLGAELARGRHLLLMNSDVIPDRPGWLGGLSAVLDADATVGAVAPKLLYEDGSIQHAGLYFERAAGAEVWTNEHYFKGMHGDLPEACVSRVVPAVSAACMMLRRDQYLELGGLRGIFVQGDYEDSDLCLRLADAGLRSWYQADVELFHLEGQSYPSAMRQATGAYNKWLHTHLWDERISARTDGS